MSQEQRDVLKRCPFCGGKAVSSVIDDTVGCVDCSATTHWSEWNRRYPDETPAPPEAVRRWRCEKHPDYISPDHHKPVWHSGPTGGNYCEGPFVVEDSGSAGGGV